MSARTVPSAQNSFLKSEVNAIETSKVVISGNCGTITSICTVFYRYDEKLISFNRIDSFSSPTDINISMYPPDSLDYKNLPKGVVAKARIFGDFDDYNGQLLPNGGRILLKFQTFIKIFSLKNLRLQHDL